MQSLNLSLVLHELQVQGSHFLLQRCALSIGIVSLVANLYQLLPQVVLDCHGILQVAQDLLLLSGERKDLLILHSDCCLRPSVETLGLLYLLQQFQLFRLQLLHCHMVSEGNVLHLVVFALQVFESLLILPYNHVLVHQLSLQVVLFALQNHHSSLEILL